MSVTLSVPPLSSVSCSNSYPGSGALSIDARRCSIYSVDQLSCIDIRVLGFPDLAHVDFSFEPDSRPCRPKETR